MFKNQIFCALEHLRGKFNHSRVTETIIIFSNCSFIELKRHSDVGTCYRL